MNLARCFLYEWSTWLAVAAGGGCPAPWRPAVDIFRPWGSSVSDEWGITIAVVYQGL